MKPEERAWLASLERRRPERPESTDVFEWCVQLEEQLVDSVAAVPVPEEEEARLAVETEHAIEEVRADLRDPAKAAVIKRTTMEIELFRRLRRLNGEVP
jgi:hypothetical protein